MGTNYPNHVDSFRVILLTQHAEVSMNEATPSRRIKMVCKLPRRLASDCGNADDLRREKVSVVDGLNEDHRRRSSRQNGAWSCLHSNKRLRANCCEYGDDTSPLKRQATQYYCSVADRIARHRFQNSPCAQLAIACTGTSWCPILGEEAMIKTKTRDILTRLVES